MFGTAHMPNMDYKTSVPGNFVFFSAPTPETDVQHGHVFNLLSVSSALGVSSG